MTHVLFCRHGQTDANAAGIVQGHLPTPLNTLGHQQARLLGERLRGYTPPITRLISSPLRRAMETAQAIAGPLTLPIEEDPRWAERHFGSGQGKPFDLLRIMTDGQLGHIDPPDAEPRDEFDARVRAALDDITGAAVVAIVTHGGVIGSVTRQLIGGGIRATNPPAERRAVPNCSILHLWRSTPSEPWTLECIADASHLEVATTQDAG